MKKIISLGLTVLTLLALTACTGGSKVAASTIAIDVNPSLVLELDEKDKIMNVIKNNADADIIVGDMDLIGVDYNIGVNALIGSMVANGYINELANSVLLSIQSNDEVKESKLMTELSQAVKDVLTGSAIEGSVITQELDFEVDAEALAKSLGISEAKAELILDVIELDPRVTAQSLAQLSINDLNLFLESKNYALNKVNKVGKASDLGFITLEEAYQSALTELGLDELSVVEFKTELEQEDGKMVYKVKVKTNTEDFKVLIDAKEGTVYVGHDDDDDEQFPTNALTEDAVLELVLAKLGVDLSLITELEVDQEMEHGVAYYEIKFKYQGEEYELEVDAVSGVLYSNSMEAAGMNHQDEDDEHEEDQIDENNEHEDDESDED